MSSAEIPKRKPLFQYGIYIPLICFIIFSVIDVVNGDPKDWANYVLSNLLVIALGYQMFFMGLLHVFFGKTMAGYIGWETGSPFQFEVGIAGMAIGALGILCTWFTGEFWLAAIIAASIFMWGCSLGHLRDMIRKKNYNPGSAGYVFYWDMLMPVAMIVLYSLTA